MRFLRDPRFLALSGLSLLLLSLLLFRLNRQEPAELAIRSGSAMEAQYKAMSGALLRLGQTRPDPDSLYADFEQGHIALFLYRNDSLLFWNNTRINPSGLLSKLEGNSGILRSVQGYFLFLRQQEGHTTSLALSQLCPDYPIQNNYLRNTFLSWTALPETAVISGPGEQSQEVKAGGKTLFYFKTEDALFLSEFWILLLNGIFYLSFLLLLSAALSFANRQKAMFPALSALLALLFFRVAISWFKWPAYLYLSPLYDLREFGDASSWMGIYYGDLLLNAILLLFAAILFYRKAGISIGKKALIAKMLVAATGAVLSALLFYHSLSTLVVNSTLRFDFLSVYTLKPLAFGALAILCLNLIALFVFLYAILKHNSVSVFGQGIPVFLACSLVFSMLNPSMYWSAHLLLPLCSAGLLVLWRLRMKGPVYYLFLHLIIGAWISSTLFTYQIDKSTEAEMRLLSYSLSERQDPTLENEYRSVQERIVSDQRLKNLIDLLPATRSEISAFLKQSYFGSYFNRYNVEVFLFDERCHPLLESSSPLYRNQGYFEDLIRYHGEASQTKDLYFISGHKTGTRYVSRLQTGNYNLFVLIDSKEWGEQGSFPDLLLDASQQKQQKAGTFSYAVYRSGRLVNRFGENNYPHFPPDSMLLAGTQSGFEHHVFEPEPDTKVIISKSLPGFTDKFSYNSYVLVIYLATALVLLVAQRLFFPASGQTLSLTQRIQAVVVLLLFFAMAAVGFSSVQLVRGQFEQDTKKDLSEKSSIVLNNLLEEYKSDELFDATQQDRVNQSLLAISANLDCDISLFAADGSLLSSTQPKLYELGLSAGLLNPRSFSELRQNKVYFSTVEERAGRLRYFSHYLPLFGERNQLIGFVNLPYFSRQSGLQKELSALVSALINVYLALFVLSLFVSLLLAGYMTRPLRFIKQQMARVSFGKHNEAVVWNSDDEIGKLVQEYNLMLLKLEDSAKRLAQSERESAWREMAKQVAHEIKNPLTPMKLNLQHLQYLSKNDPAEFNARFGAAAQSIIEQIDSLASIASAFSNFARLPGMELKDIEPLLILEHAVQLYDKNPAIRISSSIGNERVPCKGDKEQCMRVFNNILSNAVEALENRSDAQIVISSSVSAETLQICIKDNGCGIPDELKASLFSPNFTTKSSGSGLGLAMVKNIMQGFGGKVWFESEKDRGSSFFLEFIRSRPEGESLPSDKV